MALTILVGYVTQGELAFNACDGHGPRDGQRSLQ